MQTPTHPSRSAPVAAGASAAAPRFYFTASSLTWWTVDGGYANYIVDDFGQLTRLTPAQDHARMAYTQRGLADEAECRFQHAQSAVAEARLTLRDAQEKLLAALPPGAAL